MLLTRYRVLSVERVQNMYDHELNKAGESETSAPHRYILPGNLKLQSRSNKVMNFQVSICMDIDQPRDYTIIKQIVLPQQSQQN